MNREVCARKRPTLPMTNREGVSFHNDYIPLPPTSPQVSARRVRPARWRGPELPGVFRADPAPPDPVYAFTQVKALRPKALRIAKTTPFGYPHGYIKRASELRFRSSEALSNTWWQVKDSNLRSFRDGFTDHRLQASDQRQCLSPSKLPGVFPADSRRQPTSAVANRTRNRLSSRRLFTGQTGLLVRNQVPAWGVLRSRGRGLRELDSARSRAVPPTDDSRPIRTPQIRVDPGMDQVAGSAQRTWSPVPLSIESKEVAAIHKPGC
jgi:hypothetical protein